MVVSFGEQVVKAEFQITSHMCKSDSDLQDLYDCLERELLRIACNTHELLRAMSSIREDDLAYPPARMTTEKIGAEALANCLFDSLPTIEEELDLPENVVCEITVQWQGATGKRQL